MEEEKLFRIGDVAKMFHISTGTLRHYERIGIVVPEFIEEKAVTVTMVSASLRCSIRSAICGCSICRWSRLQISSPTATFR